MIVRQPEEDLDMISVEWKVARRLKVLNTNAASLESFRASFVDLEIVCLEKELKKPDHPGQRTHHLKTIPTSA